MEGTHHVMSRQREVGEVMVRREWVQPIGHADEDQLRDYMDSTLPERRAVIDQIHLPF